MPAGTSPVSAISCPAAVATIFWPGFATPGGNVFVSRGLVLRMHSEAELAGVLAHEIAHVVQKHHLNDIRKNASKKIGRAHV